MPMLRSQSLTLGAAVLTALLPPLVLPSAASAAEVRTVSVPGTANIFAAGRASVPLLPGGGGTLPPSVAVAAGTIVTMSATGSVGCGGGAEAGPDGSTGGGTVSIQSDFGIAGADIPGGTACGLSLVGVFTAGTISATAPARLGFVTGDGTAFPSLAPELQQAFFVGDGRTGTGSGTVQQFIAPAGATALWVGFQDGQHYQATPGYYADNTGGVTVTIDQGAGSAGRTYVALGDSFASGEGAEESEFGGTTYPDPKAPGSTVGCHRSTTSWAHDVHMALGANVDGWDFVACSGAVVDDLYGPNDTYLKANGTPEPPQLAYVDRRTYRATLSIGGNDAHFADILRACVQYPRNDGGGANCRKKHAKGRQLADEGLGYLRNGIPVPSLGAGVTKSLAQVYVDTAYKMALDGRLVVAGYPRMFATSRFGYRTSGTFCKVGTGAGLVPILMHYEDAQWLNDLAGDANRYISTAVDEANRTLRRAGSKVVVDFAATSGKFTDHRLCGGDRWFNGVELTFPDGPGFPKPKQVSFHPNAHGQDAYASAVVPYVLRGV
jgi:hypothetical protein